VLSWRWKPNMEELLRMWRGREFHVVGAATAKLREPKHVRTRGTSNMTQYFWCLFFFICIVRNTVMDDQHRWAPAYPTACHYIYIIMQGWNKILKTGGRKQSGAKVPKIFLQLPPTSPVCPPLIGAHVLFAPSYPPSWDRADHWCLWNGATVCREDYLLALAVQGTAVHFCEELWKSAGRSSIRNQQKSGQRVSDVIGRSQVKDHPCSVQYPL